MKIAEGVDVLTLKSNFGTIYPVLIWDKKDVILVDAGFPMTIDVLGEEILKAGFGLDKITKIIFTHQDIDHIGCINELKEASPNITTFAHEEEVPYIQGDQTPIKLAKMTANYDYLPEEQKKFYEFLKSGFENRRTKIDKVLVDGEVLPFCGGIEVIHTPGHTPGHICLYLKNSKVVIGGDGLNINENGQLVGAKPEHTENMEQALSSVKKIVNYDVETVVSYHSGIFKGDVKGDIAKL